MALKTITEVINKIKKAEHEGGSKSNLCLSGVKKTKQRRFTVSFKETDGNFVKQTKSQMFHYLD